MESTIHAFEKAGLGKAPFRFVGAEERWFQPAPDVPKKPGSSCDYCSHSIAECCFIEDANGKRFKVGNVCVEKTGDSGLINETKRAVLKLRREAKAIKDDARIEAAKSLYVSNTHIRETLSTFPHPNEALALKGLRKSDYVDWMFANAGTSGQLTAARIVETIAKGIR